MLCPGGLFLAKAEVIFVTLSQVMSSNVGASPDFKGLYVQSFDSTNELSIFHRISSCIRHMCN